MNSLNLLPWKFRRRLLLRVRIVQWSVAALLACGFVAAAAGYRYAQHARRERTLERLEARCGPLAAKKAETERIRARVTESKRMQGILSHVENQELPLKAMGLVSRVVQSADGRLELQGLSLARSIQSVTVPDKPKETQNEELVSLMVSGKAVDNLAVADMVLRLRESGVFDTVSLKPTAASPEARNECPFQIECVYRTKSL